MNDFMITSYDMINYVLTQLFLLFLSKTQLQKFLVILNFLFSGKIYIFLSVGFLLTAIVFVALLFFRTYRKLKKNVGEIPNFLVSTNKEL